MTTVNTAPSQDHPAALATAAGAEWLASAALSPRAALARWAAFPTAPAVLPCGTVFDVINVPAVFGRRMLNRLWSGGPGSGPVAAHRGRTLLFAAPGTAHRLPALLNWEEWGRAVPPPLCHGAGDAVAVPAPNPRHPADGTGQDRDAGSRWLVAPDVRYPWLPGPEILLWACVRAARGGADPSIFVRPEADAKVVPVGRR
ncbi:bifunctional DNA primase/polymerase [Streptomyces pathocidini]|uniref:bifunctional DNA primase/polymerase n=1 Tax=Streptomyces pathocidini TaxID=1650571 RepID=UPI00340AEFF0